MSNVAFLPFLMTANLSPDTCDVLLSTGKKKTNTKGSYSFQRSTQMTDNTECGQAFTRQSPKGWLMELLKRS